VERVVEKALIGKWHTLPADLEQIGQEVANLCSGWARNVSFRMLRYDEARNQDPRVDSWMLLAENASLSAHGFICEDGPELPKEKGQEAAQEGGETLERMYAQGCDSLEQAKLQGAHGTGAGIQSAQERTPTPVPSDEDDEEMTYGQRRVIRRFGKGRRPGTASGIGERSFKILKG
jgi:hypothetical protein